MTIKRVCIVLTTRGNYAKMKSTMRAVDDSTRLTLDVVIGGALLSSQYGEFRSLIEEDGFAISDTLPYPADGGTPYDIALAAGKCTVEMANVIEANSPDFIMIIADRYESLAIAQAAVCMNIRLAHLEGGELSGSIDERIRHAITKLGHIHFPANDDAAKRIVALGEDPRSVHVVGTPSLDLVAELSLQDVSMLSRFLSENGIGSPVDVTRDYIVISQHSVVTEYDDVERQFRETAKAVVGLAHPTIWVTPNDDAGGSMALEVIADLEQDATAPHLLRIGNLPIEHYVVLLKHARCLIGNTSSGVREGAFLGVPTVNVGNRQRGRLRGPNVIDVDHDAKAIMKAAQAQIKHGFYASDPIYGDGRAGPKIASVLETAWPQLDKELFTMESP